MAAPIRMRLWRDPVFTSNLFRHLCCGQKLNFSNQDGSPFAKGINDYQNGHKYSRGHMLNLKLQDGSSLPSARFPSCLQNTVGLHPKRAFSSLADPGISSRQFLKAPKWRSVMLSRSFLHHQSLWRRGYARSRRQMEGWGETEGWTDTEGRSQQSPEDAAWTLRSSLENVYLSWVRNTYILTVAGVTVYAQMTIPLAEEAAVLFFFSGGINLLTGTVLYMHNIFSLRKRLLMSRIGSLALGSLAGLHVFLWLAAIMLYLGYIEDDVLDIEEEIRKEEEITKQRRQRQRSRHERGRYD